MVDGEARSRARHEVEDPCGGRDGHRRHGEDCDRDDDHDDRGRHGDRRSASWRDRLFRSRSRAPRREERGGSSRGDRRHDEQDSRGRRDDGGRHRSALLAPDARKIDEAKVQLLPDGAVILASGRRARHREAAPERRSRSSEAAAIPRTEDNRGRSPPPSPRTTSRDIIELRPSSAIPEWLCRLAPCLGSQVSPGAPPGWTEGPRAALLFDACPHPSCPSTPIQQPAPVLAGNPNVAREAAAAEPDAPLHQPAPVMTEDPPMTSEAAAVEPGTPLFVPRPCAILPTPNSTPPRPPTTRRKTLAGASGLTMIRSSPRLQAKTRDMPIALLAESIAGERSALFFNLVSNSEV